MPYRRLAQAALFATLLALGMLLSTICIGDGGAGACAAVAARPCTTSTVTVPGPTTTVTSTVTSTTTPTTTTTPTPGAAVGANIGLMKFGSSTPIDYASPSSYSDCIVGPNQADDIASWPCRKELYMCGVNIPDVDWSDGCGVSITEARASGWLLHDAAGAEVHYGGCSEYSYLADIGDPAYQQAWIADVRRIMAATPGFKVVYIDNVIGNRIDWCEQNTTYTSDAAYRAAMLEFISVVGPALHSSGYLVSVNGSMNDGAIESQFGEDSCGGRQRGWWAQQLAPYIDIFSFEYWETFNSVKRILGSATCGQFWLTHADSIDTIEAAGLDAAPVASGNDTDGTALYVRASFLLRTDRPTSFLMWACGGQGAYSSDCDPALTGGGAWRKQMGRALGAEETLASGVRRRLFEQGYVYVNPTASTQTLPDGRTLPSASAFLG